MKTIIRCFCLVLALSICLAVPVSAAELPAPYASNFFSSHNTYLWETSSTSFQVWFNVTAVGTMSEIGVDYIEIECSSDGVNWSPVKTYSRNSYSNLIKTNSATHCSYVTYSERVSGLQYRAYVELYAKNASGSRGYYGTYAYF